MTTFLRQLRLRWLRRADPPAQWLRADRRPLGERLAFDLRTPTLSLRTPTSSARTPTPLLSACRSGPGPDFVDTVPGLAPGKHRR